MEVHHRPPGLRAGSRLLSRAIKLSSLRVELLAAMVVVNKRPLALHLVQLAFKTDRHLDEEATTRSNSGQEQAVLRVVLHNTLEAPGVAQADTTSSTRTMGVNQTTTATAVILMARVATGASEWSLAKFRGTMEGQLAWLSRSRYHLTWLHRHGI